MLWAAPTPAQAPAAPQQPTAAASAAEAGRTRETKTDSMNTTDQSGFPEPFGLSLFLMVACGAVGAFAADLASDGGRLERPGKYEQGFMLGFLGKLVVGSVAAVIVLTLNPTGDALWSLMGTALTAGLGGEAILLSRMATLQAQEDKKDREAAQHETTRVDAQWAEKLETFRVIAIETHGRLAAPAVFGAAALEAPAPATFERIVNTYAQRARAEMVRADA
jgi:carbon starvation protein CstA